MIKVIDNALRTTKFEVLLKGETFKLGSIYCMKTSQIQDGMEIYNAIDLSDGELLSLCNDDMVIPFNCELIVL